MAFPGMPSLGGGGPMMPMPPPPMPPMVMDMPPPDMASMLFDISKPKPPIASELIADAIEMLEKARDMDKKVVKPVSDAIAALRGNKEEKVGTGAMKTPSTKSFREESK